MGLGLSDLAGVAVSTVSTMVSKPVGSVLMGARGGEWTGTGVAAGIVGVLGGSNLRWRFALVLVVGCSRCLSHVFSLS